MTVPQCYAVNHYAGGSPRPTISLTCRAGAFGR